MKMIFLLQKRTVSFVFASLALLVLFSFGEVKAQKAYVVKRYENLGDNVYKNTGYNVSEYEACIVGFRALNGDIQEKEAGDIMRVYMFKNNGKWFIRADFRTHKNNENWYVDVLFISKGWDNVMMKTNGKLELGATGLYVQGNVGIGKSEPNEKLHIKGKANESVYGLIEAEDDNQSALKFKTQSYNWTMGIHGGDQGKFKLSKHTALGVNDYLTIDTEGLQVGKDIRVGIVQNTNNNSAAYGNKVFFSGGRNFGTGNSENSDPLWIGRFNKANDKTELRVNIGDRNSEDDKFVIGYTEGGAWKSAFSVGVNGRVVANRIALDVGSFPDYVFDESYDLMPLEEVEAFIQKNKHLPKMPSETEVVKNGMDVAQINTILVEKVEELTLYTIALKKELENLKNELKKSADKK